MANGCGLVDDEMDSGQIKKEISGDAEGLASSMPGTTNVVWCTNKSWRVDFYAEPEHINLVGWFECQCFQPQARVGSTSSHSVLAYEFTCEEDGR